LNQRPYNSPFAESFVFQNSPRDEDGKIKRRFDASNQFGDVAPYCRALLEAVTGETVGEVKVFQLRPLAEYGIAVQGVDGIKAVPSPDYLERVKGRNKLG